MNQARLQKTATIQLTLAADHYNRYPGEHCTYYLRFTVPDDPAAVLQLAIPHNMTVESYTLPPGIPPNISSVIEADQNLIISIPLGAHFSTAVSYDVSVKVLLDTLYVDHYLIADAAIVGGDAQVMVSESLQIAVYGQGKYLEYLPDIYTSDDFTSRFLMLFESFWKPISQQIDQAAVYFDPRLTPPEFVPWLASWFGLHVDELLPLERVRKLLENAMMLFQRRGTFQALKTYLEIFSAGEVDIMEYQAKNFILGTETSLGMGIALGTENQPGTISINLTLPQSELTRTQYSEEMYQRKISEVVRSFVPAHTICRVQCEFYA
jgi:phage tail-like protein